MANMAMMACPACTNTVAKTAQFCPKCGHKFYNSFAKFLKIVFLIGASCFALLIVVVIAFNSANSPNGTTPTATRTTTAASTTASTTAPKSLPDEDKAFVSASLGYLGTANEDGTKLAKVWASASDGTSDLLDCKMAAQKAEANEGVRYRVYLNQRGHVPVAFQKVDQDIVLVHQRTINSLKEILSYWEPTGGLSSLQTGLNDFQATIVLMNQTINEGRAVTQSP